MSLDATPTRVTHFTLPTDRLLVISDVHGRVRTLDPIFAAGAAVGATTAVQLGDLAIPTATAGPAVTHDQRALSYIRRRAEAHGIESVIALRGNHDSHPILDSHEDDDGFVRLSGRVRYGPRMAIATTPSGARLALVSGAGSVDRGTRPSGRWHANEVLSDAELAAFSSAAAGTIDVVLAHDAPGAAADTALGRRLAATAGRWNHGDLAYAQSWNRSMTALVAGLVRPDGATVLSGHHHLRSDSDETLHGVPLRVVVLDETYHGHRDSYAILDVSSPRRPTVQWPGADGHF